MYSIIVSRQYLDYLEDQFLFVNALPDYIKSNLTIRLLKNDYGWDQKMRWYDHSPKIKLDYGEKSIDDLIIKCLVHIYV